MITDRQDPQVLKAIEIAKKRANGYDEISGLPSDELEAHHIKSWYSHPKLRADPDNLIVIDRRIHHGFVHNGYTGYLLGCSEKAIEGYRRLHETTDKESPIYRYPPSISTYEELFEYDMWKEENPYEARLYEIGNRRKVNPFETSYIKSEEVPPLGIYKRLMGQRVGNLTKAECPSKKRGISISDEELIERAKKTGSTAWNARRTLKKRGVQFTFVIGDIKTVHKVMDSSPSLMRNKKRASKLSSKIDEIMKVLTSKPQFAAEIAEKVKMTPAQVSKVLKSAINAGIGIKVVQKKNALFKIRPAYSV